MSSPASVDTTAPHPSSVGPLSSWSFRGLNATQFLGAFNDNLFKQLVLLLCVEEVKRNGGPDAQSIAGILFAAPFLLFSGIAGVVADRYSKRSVILACKTAEVLIVLLGMAALASKTLWGPLAILSLFGLHSAFFGPAKYGILPEIVKPEELPRANGTILMTTFLAIILGLACAGGVVQLGRTIWGDRLWPVSVACLVVAILGWTTARWIRPLPAAAPQLKFTAASALISAETFRALWTQPGLLGCILASSMFWFAGGMVYPPAINATAKLQFELNDLQTGLLAASTGMGIAIGCVVAGLLSRDRVRSWLVRSGCWGLVISLGLLAVPGPHGGGTLLGVSGSVAALIVVGVSAGFFSVPLQVYLQARAPVSQKGRVVAMLNFANWVGIAASSAIYAICDGFIRAWHWPNAAAFGFAAVLLLPLALFYRPPDALVADAEQAANHT